MKRMLAIVIAILGIAASSVAFAADLNGIVTDKDGKPVAASVSLKGADGASAGGPVSADAHGAYAFKDIKPGSYQVQVNGKDEGTVFVGPGSTRRDIRLK